MLPLLSVLTPVIDKVLSYIPNSAEKEKAKIEFEIRLQENETKILEALMKSDQIQAEINKIDAASGNKFQAYWRPALGWVCVLAFSWITVGQPVIMFVCSLNGIAVKLPEFDTSILNTVLFGMLGLAGIRSYDLKNKSRK